MIKESCNLIGQGAHLTTSYQKCLSQMLPSLDAKNLSFASIGDIFD